MNLPQNFFTRLTLSDLFDRTARLTGRVFRRGAVLGVITMLPVGMVLGFAMREIFAALADTIHRTSLMTEPSASAFVPLLYGMMEFGVALVVFVLGTIILDASVIDLVDSEMHAEERSWQDAFAHGWHLAFRILAQKFAMLMVIFAFTSFAAVASVLMGKAWPIAVLLIIGAGIWLAWLFISWTFGSQAVVCEGTGAVRGLVRSRMLVRGNWWRVFGILFLFTVLAQFAMMILTSPLQGMALSSILPDLLNNEKNMLMNQGDSASIESLLVQLSSVGWKIGMLQAVSAMLTGIVGAVYATLVYYDLRAQQGEFDSASTDEPA